MIEDGILKADGVNGISNYEVAQVLGAGSLDVGTLCTHPNINKWAKYKPLALMAANDTNRELTEAQKKGYQEGSYTKPYGIFPVKADDMYGYALSWPFQDLVFDERGVEIEKTEWKYSKPQAKGAVSVNGDGVNIFTRLSDFNGYNHLATAPLEVEWVKQYTEVEVDEEMGITTETTHSGVFAKITRSVTAKNALDLSDFRGTEKEAQESVSVVVMTADKVSMPNNTEQLRYAIGLTSKNKTLGEGESCYIGYNTRELAPLSGEFYFVVISGSPVYAQSSDGWGGSTGASPYYYPIVNNHSTNCFIPEGGVFKVSINNLQGGTLFITDNWPLKYTTTENLVRVSGKQMYDEIVDGVQSFYEYWPYIIFDDVTVATEGLMPNVTIKQVKEISSLRRRITVKCYDSQGYVSFGGNNYYANFGNYGARKAFLRDLDMYAGTTYNGYAADIYVVIAYGGGAYNSKVLMDVKYDNKVVYTRTLLDYSTSAGNNKFIGAMSFMNIQNKRGNTEGSKLQVYLGQTSEKVNDITPYEYDMLTVNSNGTVYGYPRLPMGDLHIGLSSANSLAVHPAGGRLMVDYGFYDENTALKDLFQRPSRDPLADL